MAETAAPAATAQPAPTQAQPKYAGKYADEAALETGARNAWTKVFGKDAPEKLVGDGGMFKDHGALEQFYKGLEHKISAPKETPAAPTMLDDPAKPAPEPEPVAEEDDAPAMGKWDETLAKANIKVETLVEAFEKNSGRVPDDMVNEIRKARPGWGKGDVQMLGAALSQLKATTTELAKYQRAERRAEAAKIVGSEQVLDELITNRAKFVPEAELNALDADLSSNDKSANLKGARLLKMYYDDFKASGKTPQAIGVTPAGQSYQPVKDKNELAKLHAEARGGNKEAQERIRQAAAWAAKQAR